VGAHGPLYVGSCEYHHVGIHTLVSCVATGYKIPHGGMFKYVSAANYFGEVLEWAGWALALRSLPSAAFAFFTFCNLAPRADAHHKWYKAKFEDYPANRKAIVPCLW
jgi:3-oxo-5-alpha-steroid 4-dehydrogenase 1